MEASADGGGAQGARAGRCRRTSVGISKLEQDGMAEAFRIAEEWTG